MAEDATGRGVLVSILLVEVGIRIRIRVRIRVRIRIRIRIRIRAHVPRPLRPRRFQPQVDPARERRRHPVGHRLAGEVGELERGQRGGLAQVLGPRQRQQLADQVRGALRAARDLLEGAAQLGRVAFAQRELALGAEARQRRLHLVGCIGDEALLHADGRVQPVEQVVERIDERRDLLRRAARVDRRQVVGGAVADPPLQRLERCQPARQAEPDEQYRDRQDHELREDHALDDLVGEPGPLVQGLGDLHQHLLGLLPVGHIDVQVADPHLIAAVVDGAQLDLAGHRIVVQAGSRQVGLAGKQLAARPDHLEVDDVLLVGGEEVAGGPRQGHDDAVGGDAHLLGERLGPVVERPVEGRIGERAGDQESERHRKRPEQQQRREHPVEDLAEQRALLERIGVGALDTAPAPAAGPDARAATGGSGLWHVRLERRAVGAAQGGYGRRRLAHPAPGGLRGTDCIGRVVAAEDRRIGALVGVDQVAQAAAAGMQQRPQAARGRATGVATAIDRVLGRAPRRQRRVAQGFPTPSGGRSRQ